MRSSFRSIGVAAVVALLAIAPVLLVAAPAGAASTDYEVECSSAGYACIPGHLDYTGESTWGSYVGSRHNCTSLTSWVLKRAGMAQPYSPMGSGAAWDDNARRGGFAVDGTPAVGAIAQWDSGSAYASGGHVAVVTAVRGDVITFIEDNFSSRITRRVRIGAGSTRWPDNFIHFADAAVARLLGSSAGSDQGSSTLDPAPPRATSSAPATTVLGDFNGDGTDDLLLYRPGAGVDELWTFLDDGAYDYTPMAINGTYTPFTGDFDGNGTTDIFWYTPGGAADHRWAFATNGTFTSTQYAVNGTYTPFTGDFDGNGTTDIFWYTPGGAADHRWAFATNGTFTSTQYAVNGTYTPFTGDFDGNGTTDIFWYTPGGAADHRWAFATNGTFTSTQYAVNGTYTPFTGDFDGNGTTDIFWYTPGGAADHRWAFATNGTFTSTQYAVNGTYTPFTGDFDGNGTTDIFWYTPGGIADYRWAFSPSGAFVSHDQIVNGTYRAVVGDFDGDGASDILWDAERRIDPQLWLGAGPSGSGAARGFTPTNARAAT